MIAITFALPIESAALSIRLRSGKIRNQSVEIVHTGVGQKSSERKINQFLKTNRPDFLISSGFAGSVAEDLRAGELVFGRNFSDPQLLSAAQRGLGDQNVLTVKLFTIDAVIDSVAERRRIAREHGAAAVDMETEPIATACGRYGIRMLSFRAISDSVNEPFPAPPSVLFDTEKQRTDFVRFGMYLIKCPGALPRLLTFSRQIKRARGNLTNALIRLLTTNLLGEFV
jgi:nucleoside phosphorylase